MKPDRELRVGQGYDIHPFAEGRPLILGGEEIPSPRGLGGFSDADVLLHALGDALLGAAGLGDLGCHFPPGDPRWKGASSSEILRQVREMVEGEGFRVLNCDLTVIAEEPRLGPYREKIRRRIADLLGLQEGQVGVKATTNEGLGAVGRGEGIAAQAVALLRRG